MSLSQVEVMLQYSALLELRLRGFLHLPACWGLQHSPPWSIDSLQDPTRKQKNKEMVKLKSLMLSITI